MINLIIMALLNVMFLLCNSYPKHVIELDSPFSVVNIIFNLLFYALLSIFLIVSFGKNKTIFSESIFYPPEKFKKAELRKIILIVITQLLLDVVTLILSLFLKEKAILVCTFSGILFWLAAYNICAPKEKNIFFSRKGIVPAVILAAVTAVSLGFDINALKNFSMILEKYDTTKILFGGLTKNIDFKTQIAYFISDTAAGLTLLISHMIYNKADAVKEKAVKNLICVFLSVLAAALCVGIKSFVYPPKCIRGYDIKSSEQKEYAAKDAFKADTKTIKINRVGTHFETEVVYQNTNNRLYYNGRLILEYDSPDDIPARTYEKNGNKITVIDCFEEKQANGVNFFVYKENVLCFLSEEKAVAVENGKMFPERSEELIAIYKSLIETDNWEFFCDGAGYLAKYDREFIMPYIERFANDEFDASELQSLRAALINEKYIVDVSKKLLTE